MAWISISVYGLEIEISHGKIRFNVIAVDIFGHILDLRIKLPLWAWSDGSTAFDHRGGGE